VLGAMTPPGRLAMKTHGCRTRCKLPTENYQCRIKGGARGAAAPGPAVLGAAIGGSGKLVIGL